MKAIESYNRHYDFDTVVDRRGTGCIKVERMLETYHRSDLLPMWIADMDFPSPDCVIDALRDRLDHPVIGYSQRGDDWYDAITRWQLSQHQWHVERDWITFVPGIVPGIAFAIHTFTRPGDKVLIQTPVYPPYINVPASNGRTVVEAPFQLTTNSQSQQLEMHMDMAMFAEKAKGCKLFLLCHPHNPGGYVWRRDELIQMAEICKREGVIVVSDEIHADLTLPGYTHIPFAEVSDAARDISITLASPSKAFNIPGLVSSYAIVPNPGLRRQYFSFLESNEVNWGHALAYKGVWAAYTYGREWNRQCLEYIGENIRVLQEALRDIPKIKMITPQASFLVFLDCREMHLDHEALNDWFINHAGLMLNNGIEFGSPGEGFMRMNIAVPRTILQEAIQRLKKPSHP